MEACHCLAWQWCRVVIRAGRSYQTEGQCQRVSVSALWAVVPVLLDVPRRQHHQSNVNISAWLFCCSGSWMSPSALWRFPVVGLVPPPPPGFGCMWGWGQRGRGYLHSFKKKPLCKLSHFVVVAIIIIAIINFDSVSRKRFPSNSVCRCCFAPLQIKTLGSIKTNLSVLLWEKSDLCIRTWGGLGAKNEM